MEANNLLRQVMCQNIKIMRNKYVKIGIGLLTTVASFVFLAWAIAQFINLVNYFM